MKIPLEITYRDVERTESIDELIHEKVAKLEGVCNYISSCHIAIEKPHDRPRSGSPYRVRLDITVPPSHELVAESNPGEGTQYDPLDVVIRDAFKAARRQLKKLTEQQRGKVKTKAYETQDSTGLVTKLFPEEGYGFLRSLEGREIYFHRNSVLNDDFERLELGTGVRFFVEQGEQGPQASTVQIVDKPGVRAAKSTEAIIEPPLGWQ
ncbi:MAG TPA: DNA-binding protein [Cyanobacteria bacterium UBA8803]|nr:DNA-binding protein [Cyanobacteria bacterium UBA9273]HBL57827.1 DNA-binding protein [Cyanobacteria bacterium UBA8803]